MVKIVRIADDGTEMESVVLDDFTVEVVYSGISDMLRDAASHDQGTAPPFDLSREARRRREKVLTRIRG